ncbi:MAG: hypothetical protein CMN21_24735 [Rubinisphaera sp.]|uniref:hypothetical protein n=1 Tax=Rubinisphaera sp. TaxID=2024857 RepID=UPI000C0DF7EC|nr:hypothetical protein [Rubinisphaera sp.]MBV12411.1 hypothetical protein [Rubinisphaera sp.]
MIDNLTGLFGGEKTRLAILVTVVVCSAYFLRDRVDRMEDRIIRLEADSKQITKLLRDNEKVWAVIAERVKALRKE